MSESLAHEQVQEQSPQQMHGTWRPRTLGDHPYVDKEETILRTIQAVQFEKMQRAEKA